MRNECNDESDRVWRAIKNNRILYICWFIRDHPRKQIPLAARKIAMCPHTVHTFVNRNRNGTFFRFWKCAQFIESDKKYLQILIQGSSSLPFSLTILVDKRKWKELNAIAIIIEHMCSSSMHFVRVFFSVFIFRRSSGGLSKISLWIGPSYQTISKRKRKKNHFNRWIDKRVQLLLPFNLLKGEKTWKIV